MEENGTIFWNIKVATVVLVLRFLSGNIGT